ncbi:hypothetical protein [Magnetovirga frankeli]|uniref:hypothetical protein n=1 Tax=Magnetovirga frankeli TaxID=947516 RepID=UPI003D3584BB
MKKENEYRRHNQYYSADAPTGGGRSVLVHDDETGAFAGRCSGRLAGDRRFAVVGGDPWERLPWQALRVLSICIGAGGLPRAVEPSRWQNIASHWPDGNLLHEKSGQPSAISQALPFGASCAF